MRDSCQRFQNFTSRFESGWLCMPTQHKRKKKKTPATAKLLGPGLSGSRYLHISFSTLFCWATPRAHAVEREELGRSGSGSGSALQGKDCIGNRWVLAIPRLLLLELLVNDVLLTMVSGAAAVVLALPDDADLLFGVALLLARREAGGSSSSSNGVVGRVVATTFPPRPVQVRRQMDIHLLVLLRGCNRLLLLDVTVRRREDAEGDGDSCFKIQLDCLCGGAQSGLFLDLLLRPV